MRNVSGKIFSGALWMISLRLLQRSIGLISTVILARLLVPEDFGLVAMALAFYALIELISFLGFDAALIRKQHAQPIHFNTSWTLGIILKGFAGLLLVLLAPAVARFYHEPRVEALLYVFALISVLGSLENIGIVNFRKELHFNMEFRFQLTKKLLSVIVTVVLALYFRSYWALVLGILASTVFGVVLSYLMHPYRPKLCLTAWREILGFSSWMVLDHIVSFIRERGSDFVVGRYLSPQALGAYRVGSDLAALPTTQLYLPVLRAVFPGYAKIVDQPDTLRQIYLSTQAAISTLVLPVTVMMIILAEPIVLLLLGAKWYVAIPLVQALGCYGITRLLQGNRNALFVAKGKPSWLVFLGLLEVLLMFPLILYWVWQDAPVVMVAWAKVIAALSALPFGVWLVCKMVKMTSLDFIATVWRPVSSCLLMSGFLYFLLPVLTFSQYSVAVNAALQLSILLPLATLVYISGIVSLWLLAGRPAGIETTALTSLAQQPRFKWLSQFLLTR